MPAYFPVMRIRLPILREANFGGGVQAGNAFLLAQVRSAAGAVLGDQIAAVVDAFADDLEDRGIGGVLTGLVPGMDVHDGGALRYNTHRTIR